MKLANKVILHATAFDLSDLEVGPARKDVTLTVRQLVGAIEFTLDKSVRMILDGKGRMTFERIGGEEKLYLQRDLSTGETSFLADRPVPTLNNRELVRVDTGLGTRL